MHGKRLINDFVFASDNLPAADRLRVFRDEVVLPMFGWHVESAFEGEHRFDLAALELGPLARVDIDLTPTKFTMIPRYEMQSERAGDVIFAINRAGAFRLISSGAEIDLGAGFAVMIDVKRDNMVELGERGLKNVLFIKRSALAPLLREPGEAAGKVLPPSEPALRLMMSYLAALDNVGDIAEPEVRRLAGIHLIDLMAAAIGMRASAMDMIEDRGIKAARIATVLDIIAANHGAFDLDANEAARRLAVSVRHIHRLLEETGKSFSEHLMEARLTRAHRLLVDPRLAHLKISEIANTSGFSDLTHFNRSFRRRYGDTPSGVRGQAMLKNI